MRVGYKCLEVNWSLFDLPYDKNCVHKLFTTATFIGVVGALDKSVVTVRFHSSLLEAIDNKGCFKFQFYAACPDSD